MSIIWTMPWKLWRNRADAKRTWPETKGEIQKMVSAKLQVLMLTWCSMPFWAYADGWYNVGQRYQINAARYPSKIVVCVTEAGSDKYQELIRLGKAVEAQQMVMPVELTSDYARLRKAKKCTAIGSISQAQITKVGVSSHQANFYAFGGDPMWGWYLYFGGKVNK